MKKNSILIAVLVFGAALAQSQTPSGGTANPGKGGGTTNRPSVGTAARPATPQTPAAPNPPATQPGGAVDIAPIDESRQRVLLNPQDRPGFGGTNQPSFGGTNQINFAPSNQPSFRTNSGLAPTNFPRRDTNFPSRNKTNLPAPPTNRPTAGGTVLNEASGAASTIAPPANLRARVVGQAEPTDVLNAQTGVTGDQAFAQHLEAALAQTGATRVFFPQTRSTIQVMNQNGTVTLQGTVANAAERQDIETRVRAMRGVNGVNNQLQIPNGQPSGTLAPTNFPRIPPQKTTQPQPAPGSDRRLLNR